MDEITIGDKTYISSKQAAKITGYAKDYVGQLCREGRVEARLVGRNWYVLDSAIREHRFGKEEEAPKVQEPAEVPVDRVSTWQKPQYVAETPSFVPDLVQKTPETVGSPAIADMQSAWREWFEEKKAPQAALPDGSEDFKDEYLPVIVPELPVEEIESLPTVSKEPEDIEKGEEMVVISRIRHQPEEQPQTQNQTLEGEEVELHRSYTTANTPRREYEDNIEAPQLTPKVQPIPTQRPVTEKGPSNGVVRALLLALSLIAAMTALIGTGNADQLLSGTSLNFGVQKEIVDFLGGKSTYESSL